MKTNETWRPIPSLPGYLACSDGRIMRIPYVSPMPHGGHRVYGGEPHFGVWEKTQKRFIYQVNGKTYKIHRLVCEAFNGAPPTPKSVCMHLDENPKNNAVSNLAWGTQKENLNAPGFIEYCRSRTGENSPTVKGRRSKV